MKMELEKRSDLIRVYHGGHRWEMPAIVRPPRKGRYECGPGIYATTSLARAAKYAKGGGSIFEFGIEPDLVFADDVELPFGDMLRFALSLRSGRKTADDLEFCARKRIESGKSAETLPASYLLNLAISNEILSGQSGIWFAKFFVENGIHANLEKKNEFEDWIVVFDPKKIVECRRMNSDKIVSDQMNFESVSKQISDIRNRGYAPSKSMGFR